MVRELPTVSDEFCGVFSTRAAARAGWTPAALLHGVECGRLTRLARGVYIESQRLAGEGPEADRLRASIQAIAAGIAVPTATPSHTSAAVLAGVPVWQLPDHACVTVTPRFTGDARCAHLHRARLPTEHVVGVGPRRRSGGARTILDTAREHGIEDAVVIGDYALRHRMTTLDELGRVVESCERWPGIRRARTVVDLLDPRSESPLESVSRLRLALTRLPQPEPQVEIFDHRGVLLGRLDFYWDEFGVAGEVDGKLKYRDRPDEVRWREKRRQEPMEDTGVLFVRWGRPDLATMAILERRVRTVLARGARRPRSDRAWIARPTPRMPLTVPRLFW